LSMRQVVMAQHVLLVKYIMIIKIAFQ